MTAIKFIKTANNTKDLTGKVVGRLTVLGPFFRSPEKKLKWLCQCECGNMPIILGSSISMGVSRSCGCFDVESFASRSTTHGMSTTAEYRTWKRIKQCISNPCAPRYEYYGGRGIGVSDEWRDSFEMFYSDMGARPKGMTIERIDNNGDYCKENCKWATVLEQANNRRSNHTLTHEGRTRTIAEWSRLLCIPYGRLIQRVGRLGWSTERALTEL